MERSSKQSELIELYNHMAENGYKRSDGQFIKNAYADFELHRFRNPVGEFLAPKDIRSVLDYGCGGSDWDRMHIFDGNSAREFFGLDEIFYYEPARGTDQRQKADCVVCFDVLEHVFLGDITSVLRDIFSHARKAVVLNVACYPAAALLPTGENAHITVRGPMWWQGVLLGVRHDFPHVETLLFCSTAYTKAEAFVLEPMNACHARDGFVR